MLRTTTISTKLEIRDRAEFENLTKHLRVNGYSPLVYNIFKGTLESLGFQGNGDELLIPLAWETFEGDTARTFMYSDFMGEIFFYDSAVLVLAVNDKKLDILVIHSSEHENPVNAFCVEIETGIKATFDGRRTRGMSFDWKKERNPQRILGPRYRRRRRRPSGNGNESVEDSFVCKEPEFDAADISAVGILKDSSIREAILLLARSKRASGKTGVEGIEQGIIDQVMSEGLIREEYLLMCKQDSHTICTLPSTTDLNGNELKGVHCSVCGRPFCEESLQVIYPLTDKGKRLTNGSLWMYIWVTEILRNCGVEPRGIKWFFEANGEEFDIVIDDLGIRTIFELKDREFSLGDAYRFVPSLTRYDGSLGVIATTENVAQDAKKFCDDFARRDENINIEYLEGIDNIGTGIKNIIEKISHANARYFLRIISEPLGFNFWPLCNFWLRAKQEVDS